MKMRGEGDYIPITTLSPPEYNFCRERRAEADSNRGPSAYQPNALQLFLDDDDVELHVLECRMTK